MGKLRAEVGPAQGDMYRDVLGCSGDLDGLRAGPYIARLFRAEGRALSKVRLGIVGVGGMGTFHAGLIRKGEVPRCELAAVCDAEPANLKKFDDGVARFTDSRKLIRSGAVDAVLVATPHYAHATVGADALGQGLHVLVEKPVAVHKADAERLNAACRGGKQVFAAMFNQRADPLYRKVKDLMESGELGDLIRVTWIITAWFRPDAYYASGSWRATWAGEGGGVLLNQSPHQLDLLQWLCGMPRLVRGFCGLGRRHRIEVEDEVTAYLEYDKGATGVFITSTGEAPGVNRLEIAGQRGRLVAEGDKLVFFRNEIPADVFCRTSRKAFAAPQNWRCEIPVPAGAGQHATILNNFADAILDGAPLIAPGKEGIRSVELANAMLYSSVTCRAVTLPLDGRAYERLLKRLIRESKCVKRTRRNVNSDPAKSF